MSKVAWGKLTDREVIFLNATQVTMGRLELGVATPQELTDFLKYSVDEAKTAKAPADGGGPAVWMILSEQRCRGPGGGLADTYYSPLVDAVWAVKSPPSKEMLICTRYNGKGAYPLMMIVSDDDFNGYVLDHNGDWTVDFLDYCADIAEDELCLLLEQT